MADDANRIGIIIDAVNKASSELNAVKRDLLDLNDGASKAGTGFEQLQKKMKAVGSSLAQVGAVMTASLTLPIIAGLKSAVDAAVSFEDQLANVRKTTGATVQELDKIGDSLLGMSANTRTSAEELVGIATIGGQMGIAADDVVGFTDAIDKANVALGDEFAGGAEEITNQMGVLRNLFSDIKSDDVSDDLLKTSNAINVLGAAGLATGGYVTEAAKRIAGIGIPLGQTSGEVLGLAATMQELGINVERGSTAVGGTLQLLAKNAEGFAEIAGQSVGDFTNLVNTDINGAFVAVLDGINELNPSTTELATILDDLGLDGRGLSELFLKMASSTDLLKEKQDLASKSLKNTDSIMSEYNIKNETTAAQLEKLKNNFNILGVTIGGILLPAINGIIAKVVPLVQGFAKFAEANPGIVKLGTTIALLVAALGPLLIILGGVAIAIGALMTPVGIVVAGIAGGIAAFTALGVAISQNEAASSALSAIWNGALMPVFQGIWDVLQPIGALISGVVSVGFKLLVGILQDLAAPLELVGRLFGGVFTVVGKVAGVIGNALGAAFDAAKNKLAELNPGFEELKNEAGFFETAISKVKEAMTSFGDGIDQANLAIDRGAKDTRTYSELLSEMAENTPDDAEIAKAFVNLKDEIINTKEVSAKNIDEMQAKINEFLGIEPPENLKASIEAYQVSTDVAREGAAKNFQLIANLAAENSEAFKKSLADQGFAWEDFGKKIGDGTIDGAKGLEIFEKAIADSGGELDGVTERLNVGLDNVKQNLGTMEVAAKGIASIGTVVGDEVMPELDRVKNELIASSTAFEEVFAEQEAGWVGGKKSATEYYDAIQTAILSVEEAGGTLGKNVEKMKADLDGVKTSLQEAGVNDFSNLLPQDQAEAVVGRLESIVRAASEASPQFKAEMDAIGLSAENLGPSIDSSALTYEAATVTITRAAEKAKDELGESYGFIEDQLKANTEVAEKYGVDFKKVADTTGVAAYNSSSSMVKSLLAYQKEAVESGNVTKKFAIDLLLSNARAKVSGKEFAESYKQVYGTLETTASKSSNELAVANVKIMGLAQKLVGEVKGRFTEAGQDAGDGLGAGVSSKLSSIEGTISVLKTLFATSGEQAGEGMAQGIRRKMGVVREAAAALAQAAADSSNNTLVIQSPSKVFEEIGANTAAGMALGIRKGTPAVLDEISRLTNGTIEEQKELVGMLESALDFEGGAGITRGGVVVETFSSIEDGIKAAKDAIKELNEESSDFSTNAELLGNEIAELYSGFEPPENIIDTYDELSGGLDGIRDSIGSIVDAHDDFIQEAQDGIDDYASNLEDLQEKFDDIIEKFEKINEKFDEMSSKASEDAGADLGDSVVDALEQEKDLNDQILTIKNSIFEKEVELANLQSEGKDSTKAQESLEKEKEKLATLEGQKATVQDMIASFNELNNNAGALTDKLKANAEATAKAEEQLAKLQSNSKASADQISAQQEKINALKQEELILIGKQILSQQSLESANAKIQDAKERENLSDIDYIALNLAREKQAIEEKREAEMAAKEAELAAIAKQKVALEELKLVQDNIVAGTIKDFDTSGLTSQEAIDKAAEAVAEEEEYKSKLANQFKLLEEFKATELELYESQYAELTTQQADYESFVLGSYTNIIAKLEELRQKAVAAAAAQAKVKGGGGFLEGGFTGPGFDTGGFTGGTNKNKIAGWVHEGEWVAPQWMVRQFGGMFKSLESARLGRMSGFSEGGYSAPAPSAPQNTYHQPITIHATTQTDTDMNAVSQFLAFTLRAQGY